MHGATADEVWRSSGAERSSVWHAAPREKAPEVSGSTCGARGVSIASCIEKDADRRARERYEYAHSYASDTTASGNTAYRGWPGGSCFRSFPGSIRLVREARGIAEEKKGI